MKARADLVNKALDNLGVSASGQPAEIEDFAKVDGNVDAVLRSLGAQQIVYVPDTSNIPDEIFLQLGVVLAEACKTEFGLAADEVQKLESDKTQAISEIRAIVRGRPTYEPAQAVYF